MLEIQMKLSTAYYPQTDGQTERINQELEQYLRVFIDYRQEQWLDWLETVEFTITKSTWQQKYHYSKQTTVKTQGWDLREEEGGNTKQQENLQKE